PLAAPIPAYNKCGTISDWYCKSWQCVSTGKIWWTAPYTTDYFKAVLGPDNNLPWHSCSNWACCGVRLNPMTVTFTSHRRNLPITEWFNGKKWGGRMNDKSTYSHPGNIFIIRLSMSLETSPPVGPNKQVNSPFLKPFTKRNNPLVSLVSSAHAALVAAHAFPNNDSKCWLCLSSQPPFYEAIGSALPFANNTSDAACRLGFNAEGRATMYTTLSTTNLFKRLHGQFFIPSNGSIWACSTGATACVSGDILHTQRAFCIQVYLLPKMSVFSNNVFLSRMETLQYFPRTKREMVTTMTLALLLGLGAAGAATGIAGMIVADQNIRKLSAEIDDDLERIEQSMVALQKSLTSLSEVVLQNRRGLDLLFLKQGGLCVALKEECCFYTDSSGIVLDSMAELNTRLKDRERERSQSHTWYQEMFNFSPWLTTLLSALAGPLILLLLACTIGPCVMGRVLAFLKHRLNGISDDVLLLKHTVENEFKQPLLELASESDEDSESETFPLEKRTGSLRDLPEGGFPGDVLALEGY
uniref:Envelope protein n=1 Tax=Naja naja TaxID=35670 RepID=A0A8C6Y3C4_NAJNA